MNLSLLRDGEKVENPRSIHYAIIFGFWLIAWVVYLLNNLASTNFIAPFFGQYFAHLYRNISILPIYMIVAFYYLHVMEPREEQMNPFLTGIIWLILSLLADSALWFFIVGYDLPFIINALKFWQGSLYPIELCALFLSAPAMKWFLKQEPAHPLLLFWIYGVCLLVFMQVLAGYRLFLYIRYTWSQGMFSQ